MSRVIAVSNQKGGVGKTTTAVNLARALSILGKKVLLIDFDSQANASNGLGLQGQEYSVYDALAGDQKVRRIIRHHRGEGLDILPASMSLAGLEAEGIGEFRLKEILEPLRSDYDFIIIDCPPALGVLNTNALSAADSVLIPVQCEYYSLEGLTQLLLTIRLIQKTSNPSLRIEGLLMTMSDTRTRLSLEVSREVRQTFGDLVYEEPIPRNVKLSEAPSQGKSIFSYDENSVGAKAYLSTAREILKRSEGHD